MALVITFNALLKIASEYKLKADDVSRQPLIYLLTSVYAHFGSLVPIQFGN